MDKILDMINNMIAATEVKETITSLAALKTEYENQIKSVESEQTELLNKCKEYQNLYKESVLHGGYQTKVPASEQPAQPQDTSFEGMLAQFMEDKNNGKQ